MGIECEMFLKQLAQKLAEKNNERYADVIAWLRTPELFFEILSSVHMSVRGLDHPCERLFWTILVWTPKPHRF